MSKIRRIPLWMPFLLTVFCCLLAFIGTQYHFRNVRFGFSGGDCIEAPGSVTIIGAVTDINNQPVEGVQIRVIKADGDCPQSVAVDRVVMSDEYGNFITIIYFTIADPEAQIEISADGFTPCRFNYDPHDRLEAVILQLTITLDVMMQVEGHVRDNVRRLIGDIETCS